MSPAYKSIFAGFATLCLGLIAASALPVGLPTALDLAFGVSITREQLGMVELVLMAATVFLAAVFVTDGVIAGLGRRTPSAGLRDLPAPRHVDFWDPEDL
jgi:hypothetical protein